MSTLTSVINIIKNSISGGKLNPVKILPAPLLLCVSLRRPGMSAMDITSEWITELSKENIPIGKNTDGTNNLIIASGYAMIKSILVQVVIQNAILNVMNVIGKENYQIMKLINKTSIKKKKKKRIIYQILN